MLSDFTMFRAEVRKAMDIRHWRCIDLAKATGYSINYIYSVLNGGRSSPKMTEKVVDVLGLPKHLAT